MKEIGKLYPVSEFEVGDLFRVDPSHYARKRYKELFEVTSRYFSGLLTCRVLEGLRKGKEGISVGSSFVRKEYAGRIEDSNDPKNFRHFKFTGIQRISNDGPLDIPLGG